MHEAEKKVILDADYTNTFEPESTPNQLKKTFCEMIKQNVYINCRDDAVKKNISDLLAYSVFLAMSIKANILVEYVKENAEFISIKISASSIFIPEKKVVLLSCISEIASTIGIGSNEKQDAVLCVTFNI